MKVANDGVKTQTNGKKGNKVVGPQEGVFDPTARKDYKFKGGKMNGPADSVDKPKYQQISVTNIGSLDASTRLLQSATLDLTIGSTNFDDAGAFNQIALSAIAVFVGCPSDDVIYIFTSIKTLQNNLFYEPIQIFHSFNNKKTTRKFEIN